MMTNKVNGFHILFSIQFLLVAAGIFMDVKVGLFTLIFTVIFSAVTLIQLSNDETTEWKRGINGMVILCSIWLLVCLGEVLNPNNVMEAWNICITPYALLPLLCAILIPLVIRDVKGIELLLYIWAAFIIIATIKGYWQRNHGFSERDRFFLYALGGWRTHIIWSGIRYFSCFSDASAYGIHSGMSCIIFSLSAFFVKGKWKRIFFLFVAACSIYGMGISGTRSAMAIIVGGLLMMTIIGKNWKTMIISGITVVAVFCFFYFTEIGNNNPFIYKMRSAFHPTVDMSYLTRVENREKMKDLMAVRPFGYGIGLSKAGRFHSKDVMPYPPDSWLVSVWVETGIVGLIIYLFVHGTLFAWCAWILIFKIKDKNLRGLAAAWLCMNAGFFISTYAADSFQYPNPMPVYIGFALCFAVLQIDKKQNKEKKAKNQKIQKKEEIKMI